MTEPIRKQALRTSRGTYTRLFPGLPPLRVGEDQRRIGRRGNPCDPGVNSTDDTDSCVDAAWPIFGQLVAHDLTADRSPLDPDRRPAEITNFRAARADLEWLYGLGPIASPYLYERSDRARLLLSRSGVDVPRNQEGAALIGDPRNDSHLLINQMHVAFAKLHNRLVDDLRDSGCEKEDLFDRARRSTTWHYQHIILREFLPLLVGPSLATELIENGPRFYNVGPEGPRVPLEFAAAAYRYGHAQIRHRYQVNAQYGPVPLFPDLAGFRPVTPARAVDWTLHIGASAQKAQRISIRLPRALYHLPPEVSGVGSDHEYSSLAVCDLARGVLNRLPSGEAIAREIGAIPLDAQAIGIESLTDAETPLWLYVLREAEVLCAGERLGPVGGRIVGEVLVGILDNDPQSFRTLDRDWRPRRAGCGGALADALLRAALPSGSGAVGLRGAIHVPAVSFVTKNRDRLGARPFVSRRD